MMVIITIVVMNQSKYTSGAALKNLANSIALSLRQAQVYGVSVREFGPGTEDFSAGYGIDFNLLSSGDDESYIFFADRGVKNGIYDGSWSCPSFTASECLTKTDILYGNNIHELCYIPLSGSENCTVGRMAISFVRPETEANFVFYHNNGTVMASDNAKGGRIKLSSPNGNTRSVVIYTTGQISVQ